MEAIHQGFLQEGVAFNLTDTDIDNLLDESNNLINDLMNEGNENQHLVVAEPGAQDDSEAAPAHDNQVDYEELAVLMNEGDDDGNGDHSDESPDVPPRLPPPPQDVCDARSLHLQMQMVGLFFLVIQLQMITPILHCQSCHQLLLMI